jgi:glycosyltransferase involved in cell wall biosynthesis
MAKTPKPKVAIVCEWLVGIGGAERIVLEVHRMFPDAPIYTSQYNPAKIDWFKDADVRTGWLQKLPAGLKKFLPVLRAWYFSHLDLTQYDLVITCNFGAEAKAVRTKPGAHICLCNAPTHYYWSRYEAYLKDPGFPTGLNWLARLGLRILVAPMRRWDYRAAQRPDHMVAISSHIQEQIKKYYHRDSQVIHPPVDTERFAHASSKQRKGFVITGRQTPYKRIDLAVAACAKLNLPLTVIGNGPERERLVQMAGPTITFTGQIPDGDMPQYFASAAGFIFPGLDDFGITPLEAMAAGTPVIAYQAGGALDYVVPDKTGEFFPEQTVDSLAQALQAFKPSQYDSATIRAHAQSFGQQAFHNKLVQFINQATQKRVK